LKSKHEADEQAKQLPREGMSAKNGSCRGEDVSQQRAEGFEGCDEFCGTEEAQEPGEWKVIPIVAHPRGEQTVGEEDDKCEPGWKGNRLFKEFQMTSFFVVHEITE
jgi:hypothetical protein